MRAKSFITGKFCCINVYACMTLMLLVVCVITGQTQARKRFRKAFFQAYPTARGTVLDDVPSHSGHCGLCHYDFNGRGPKNPYGQAVKATDRSKDAILGLGELDSDGDGFSNETEITDVTTFSNTPTFPGLTPANISSVVNVDSADIQNHVVPSTESETTPPVLAAVAAGGLFFWRAFRNRNISNPPSMPTASR